MSFDIETRIEKGGVLPYLRMAKLRQLVGAVFAFFLYVGINQSHAAADSRNTKQILFFVNSNSDFPFWKSEVDFAQAVAEALSLELVVQFVPGKHRDRFGITTYISRYLKKLEKSPDLVLTSFIFGAEHKLLSLLDENSIPLISLNSYISPDQYLEIGHPRGVFPLWLGHFSPNDVVAGAQLINGLLKKKREGKDCSKEECFANVFGFTGLPYAAVSQQRVEGLKLAIAADGQSTLFNAISADWRRLIALEKMEKVVQRHKDIDVFWVASDIMAWGVVDGVKRYQYKNNALIGSMDWSPKTISYIDDGDISVSLGGHFIEAGLALIFYYDYINGKDFIEQYGSVIETKMSEINSENVAIFGPFLRKPKWNHNVLRQYSMFNNPNRKKYIFDPQKIISQQLK